EPNVDGVVWFAREVWPLVIERRPDAQFVIVGSNPAKQVRRLAVEHRGIHVTGSVSDVRQYLWQAAVSVAPLLTPRGTQNKVLDALGAGLPTVITPAVLDGLPATVRGACRVADTGPGFADAVLSLLALGPVERRALAAQAPLETMGWDCQLAGLLPILAEA